MNALVVTIVVLLILAGITITYVVGDSSIFNKASEAKLKTDIAMWKDKLELAKGPIIIEGLGTFNPDKYFEYIEEQGIINSKEKDVVDYQDGTYEVTTKPGYVFEIELMPNKEKPTDAEIEYIGQAGKLLPRIRKIVVTGKTKTSIDIKILARLEGGEVTCYYKKMSEVIENEAENNIEGYTLVTLNENLEGSITGLIAGEKYKIKAVIRKDGEDIQWEAISEITGILVSEITLDKTAAKIEEKETLQLTATIKPENAEDKTINWSSSNNNVATVSETGLVTAVSMGTATIAVTANDGSGKTASCVVTVVDIWEKINRIAKAIANDENINNNSPRATGETEKGEKYDIKVGDIFEVKYNGEVRRVRVLGFKHDNLVDTTVYGGNHNKAGISFEFYDFITDQHWKIKDGTNYGGWEKTLIRRLLNGYANYDAVQAGAIGGSGANLSNKSYIKQVIKEYIPINNQASTSTCNDYLWLLSCGEIWNNGDGSGHVGNAVTQEGIQYQYYKQINPIWNEANENFAKKTSPSGTAGTWWLRSSSWRGDTHFCAIRINGTCTFAGGEQNHYVAPGFCI